MCKIVTQVLCNHMRNNLSLSRKWWREEINF